jgi:hypothetical protein
MSFGGSKKGIEKEALGNTAGRRGMGKHWRRKIKRCDAVMSLGGNKKGNENEALEKIRGER